MLDDIIDITPTIERADALVADCLKRAASAGVGDGADALHEWAVDRASARDPLVERAMTALFRRDAAWGAADAEQDPFGRYTWELAAEMAGEPRSMDGIWTCSLGSFESCGASFEVVLHRPEDDSHETPHVHVRMECLPRVPDVCVGIYEAVYVPFGHRHWELDHRHRADFAEFMEALVFPGEAWPRWYRAEEIWDWACKEDGVERHAHLDFDRMPDYRALHWPDGEGASS